MKEIVEVIAKAIVNHPSEVQVEEERRGSTVVLKLHVCLLYTSDAADEL